MERLEPKSTPAPSPEVGLDPAAAPGGVAAPAGASARRAGAGARLVRLSFGFYGVLALVAVGWRMGVRGESVWRASPDVPIDWLGDPLLGLAAGLVTIGLSALFTRTTRIGARLTRMLARLVGRLSWRDCLALAFASGFGEELLFRGALQPELGLLWTSLVFALAHLAPQREGIAWSGFSFAAGLLLGGLYQVTGNLVAPIAMHVVVNAINLRQLGRYAPAD